MRRRILRITLWILAIPAIFLGGLFAWVQANQDSIQNRFLTAVNEQLKAQVQVGGIEVDVFGQFPDISLRLDDVLILDPKMPEEHQDTLLYFQSVFAHFELWPALRGQTNLNKVTAHGGLAHLHWDEYGNGNYDILRSDSSATSAHVNIKGLTIKDSEIRLSSAGNSPWQMNFIAQRVRLRGQLDSSSFNAHADWDLDVPQYNDQTLNLHGHMDLLRDGERIAIPEGQFKIQEWTLNLTGEIVDEQGHWHMDASALDLAKIRPWLPQNLLPEELVIQGKLDAEADIITKPSGNHIDARGTLSDGRLKINAPWIDAQIQSGNVRFISGDRADLSRAQVTLANLDIQSRQTRAHANIELRNFVQPNLDIRAQTDGDAIDLFHWLRYDTWEGTTGSLKSQVRLRKTFANTDQLFDEGPWPAHWSGTATIENTHVEIEGAGKATEIEYANLELDDQDVIIKDAKFTTGATDFRVHGTIGDALADQPLMRHNLRVTGNSWRVEDILDWEIWEADLTGRFDDDEEDWRDRHEVDLAVNQLSYDGIVVHNVSAQVDGIGLNVHAKPLSLSHADGMISGQAFYMPLPKDHAALSFEGFLSHLNLTTLMNAWDNFGQTQLTSQQISGDLNAQLNVQIEWDADWNVKEEAFVANADFTVADGRIQGYAPLLDLARFADVEDLKDVRFAPVQNQIRIANRVVNIPQMHLENNALELKVEGSHSFDNDMDFTLRLNLRDILGGDEPRGNAELRSLIEEQSDRGPVWIPMRLYGPVDDPKFSLDTKTMRTDIRTEIRQDWQAQGSEIRDAFRNPQQATEVVDPENKYEFEWDDSDSTNLQRFPSFIQ